MEEYTSLSDVNKSVNVHKKGSRWKRLFAFFGPAYLVSVGYMDPGNWVTGLEGGSRYGYALIWVMLMSNIVAILLQSLSARLGVVRRKDLAQCSREKYPRFVNFILYILAEIAIAATDLAEVLGMAIGLQLLFDIPLLWGVVISFFDTLLLMWLQKLGMRKVEAFILGLIVIISGCFVVELFFAQPDLGGIARGFIPSMPDSTALYISIGIIGATVMPHNLYLHSALVQTRNIKTDEKSIRKAIKYNLLDSTIALNIAFFVNAAILILAAAVFFNSGISGSLELKDAYALLEPLLGSKIAPILFGIALVAAGQSSTITGTLAGQIVMEGYLKLRISPVLRRIITRLLAILPAVIIILISGEGQVNNLLIFSQVLLSMQLAFAIIPLIHFVSEKKKMGVFALKKWLKIISWLIVVVIVGLNIKLVYEETVLWMNDSDSWWIDGLIVTVIIGLVLLLFYTTIYPLTKKGKSDTSSDIHNPIKELPQLPAKAFKTIALAVDFSSSDEKVFQYALKMAEKDTQFVLIHITESVPPKLMGELAEDFETRKDEKKINKYLEMLVNRGYKGRAITGFRRRNIEIVRICKESKADLLIMGSHGHKGFGDFIYGETVNKVRHEVDIPVLIAQ